MGDPEGEGLDGLLQEGDGPARGFVILDRQVDEAGGPINRDVEVALAALAILGAQLGQMLHVHMDEAKILGLERTIRLPRSAWPRQAAQALGFQDAVDRMAGGGGEKKGGYKRQGLPRGAGRPPPGT